MDIKTASAEKLLEGSGMNILDAARLIRNILDGKNPKCGLSNAKFCKKVVDCGLRSIRYNEETFSSGFKIYLGQKSHLRPDSIRDIRAIGRRIIRMVPVFGAKNFSEFTTADCERMLTLCFSTRASSTRRGRLCTRSSNLRCGANGATAIRCGLWSAKKWSSAK